MAKLTALERAIQRMAARYPNDEDVKRYLSGDTDEELESVLKETVRCHPNNELSRRLKIAISYEYSKRDPEVN